jgi:hypothetical protein
MITKDSILEQLNASKGKNDIPLDVIAQTLFDIHRIANALEQLSKEDVRHVLDVPNK